MPRKIIPYAPNLKELARKLRNDSTPGEIKLWKNLSGKQFYGYDFHRQKPLLKYIVDFYCHELDLVIELDGLYHGSEEKYEKDLLRDAELETYGLTILRFNESEIRNDLENVTRTIESYILEHQLHKEQAQIFNYRIP